MTPFDLAAIIVTLATVSGDLNHRLLKLPATSGTLVVAAPGIVGIAAGSRLFPGLGIAPVVTRFVSAIDFNQTLMRGMLAFLLFAGTLHLDLADLASTSGWSQSCRPWECSFRRSSSAA